MDLTFSKAEEAFRDEVRAFFDAELPKDIRDKLEMGRHISKDDMVRWQKILYREGLGRAQLADQVRRHGLERGAAAYFRGGARRGLRAAAERLRTEDAGAGDAEFRQRRAAGIFSAADPFRRALVVPGLLGTRFGLRPRLIADQRGAPGRSLHRQRPEDLEHHGPVRGLDLSPWCAPAPRDVSSRASRFC